MLTTRKIYIVLASEVNSHIYIYFYSTEAEIAICVCFFQYECTLRPGMVFFLLRLCRVHRVYSFSYTRTPQKRVSSLPTYSYDYPSTQQQKKKKEITLASSERIYYSSRYIPNVPVKYIQFCHLSQCLKLKIFTEIWTNIYLVQWFFFFIYFSLYFKCYICFTITT